MNKCNGCGDVIDSNKTLCERCFRIIHYNDYKIVSKTNDDFIPILNNINGNDLVVLVVDLFTIGDLSIFRKYLNNNILLVLTKRDILPKVYDEKLLNYSYGIDCVDKVIISSKNNFQFDLLLEKINKYKTSDKVYVVGYTNAGKSSMINKLIYHYSTDNTVITTSPLPSTTLNTITISFLDFKLIDTPGILEDGNILSYVSGDEIKKIVPMKEIKPITYQIKGKQYIKIDDYAIIEAENTDLTLFFSNKLKQDRYYKKIENDNFVKHEIDTNNNDIVISGLGFIKTKKGKVIIHTLPNVSVFSRFSLI